jgi:hypothetical protein
MLNAEVVAPAHGLLKTPRKVGAEVLLQAIESRHVKDLVIPECKNGPTQTGSHRRFDAWVLVRTWSPITMIGYEIKVSRSDWRRDEKLADYQGLCHLLYIVAPKGVVPLDELPAGVGLLEAVGEGTRLVTRRKASRHEITLPAELLVYILMARVRVGTERQAGQTEDYQREARRAALKQWVEEKAERRRLAWVVSKKIQQQFDAQELAIREADERIADLRSIRALVVGLGFDPDVPVSRWKVSTRLREMAGTVDRGLPDLLARTARDIQATSERLTAFMNRAANIQPADDVEADHV